MADHFENEREARAATWDDSSRFYTCAQEGCKREAMGYADELPDGWGQCAETNLTVCPDHADLMDTCRGCGLAVMQHPDNEWANGYCHRCAPPINEDEGAER